ncbi:DUF418 domain-containing protein [Micromonospora sp. NPDC003776]
MRSPNSPKRSERGPARVQHVRRSANATAPLICALIFTGLGLGLIGRVPPAGVLALALGIFATQLALSALWMRTHRYGPVEWILRAATNAECPPWRR